MEYSLTPMVESLVLHTLRLNPYSNGILSDKMNTQKKLLKICLNPYSNGILSDWPKHGRK